MPDVARRKQRHCEHSADGYCGYCRKLLALFGDRRLPRLKGATRGQVQTATHEYDWSWRDGTLALRGELPKIPRGEWPRELAQIESIHDKFWQVYGELAKELGPQPPVLTPREEKVSGKGTVGSVS